MIIHRLGRKMRSFLWDTVCFSRLHHLTCQSASVLPEGEEVQIISYPRPEVAPSLLNQGIVHDSGRKWDLAAESHSMCPVMANCSHFHFWPLKRAALMMTLKHIVPSFLVYHCSTLRHETIWITFLRETLSFYIYLHSDSTSFICKGEKHAICRSKLFTLAFRNMYLHLQQQNTGHVSAEKPTSHCCITKTSYIFVLGGDASKNAVKWT